MAAAEFEQAMHIPTSEGALTHIFRDESGNGPITRLDTYYPEVLFGEVAIGVDLALFSKSHPLNESEIKIAVCMSIDEKHVPGYATGIVGAQNDSLHATPGGVTPVINQRIGRLAGGTAAICTHSMDQAEEELRHAAMDYYLNKITYDQAFEPYPN